MIIRQAEIQKFGKLEKEQYRFSPQINIILVRTNLEKVP